MSMVSVHSDGVGNTHKPTMAANLESSVELIRSNTKGRAWLNKKTAGWDTTATSKHSIVSEL